MKAMVLAAGFGTRLRPLTQRLPKPMFPLFGRPVVEHLLRHLGRQGLSEVTLNLHHLPDPILNHFGDGRSLGLTLHYSHEQAILGTAGGILAARRYLEDGPFWVVNSDILIDLDFRRVLRFHQEKASALTLVLYDGEATGIHDPIELDAGGRVVHMVGASSRNLPEVSSRVTFTGVQLVEPALFDRIPAGRFCGTTSDVYPRMVEEGEPVYGFRHTGYWQDMGTLAQYLQVHRDVLDGRFHLPDALPSSPAPGGQIVEPVWIGPGCAIAPDARVGPYAVLYEGCRIEAGAEVANSVCWRGAVAGERCRVRHSVLGEGARVAPGTLVEQEARVPPADSTP